MTTQPLTQEKAISTWSELQRLISVGAYSERSAEHFETGTYPEDGVEESIDNLETWARAQGLQFAWNLGSKTWSLVKIAYGPETDEEDEEMAPDCISASIAMTS